MFDHVGLHVTNLKVAAKFCSAALQPLGWVVDASGAGFGLPNSPALWLYESASDKRSGCHVAFRATNRDAVDRFHREGIKAGGRDNGVPGLRANYGANYYAAFLIDPDSDNFEAVCMSNEK